MCFRFGYADRFTTVWSRVLHPGQETAWRKQVKASLLKLWFLSLFLWAILVSWKIQKREINIFTILASHDSSDWAFAIDGVSFRSFVGTNRNLLSDKKWVLNISRKFTFTNISELASFVFRNLFHSDLWSSCNVTKRHSFEGLERYPAKLGDIKCVGIRKRVSMLKHRIR